MNSILSSSRDKSFSMQKSLIVTSSQPHLRRSRSGLEFKVPAVKRQLIRILQQQKKFDSERHNFNASLYLRAKETLPSDVAKSIAIEMQRLHLKILDKGSNAKQDNSVNNLLKKVTICLNMLKLTSK